MQPLQETLLFCSFFLDFFYLTKLDLDPCICYAFLFNLRQQFECKGSRGQESKGLCVLLGNWIFKEIITNIMNIRQM